MAYCNKCRHIITGKNGFCEKCGTPYSLSGDVQKSQNQSEKKICPKCQNEMADDLIFCDKCGTKYNASASKPPQVSAKQPSDEQKPAEQPTATASGDQVKLQPKKQKSSSSLIKKIVLIALICIAVYIVIGTIYLLATNSSGDDTHGELCINIYNNTNVFIKEIYLKQSVVAYWSHNAIAGHVLNPGFFTHLHNTVDKDDLWDILIVDENGRRGTFERIEMKKTENLYIKENFNSELILSIYP
ncbi:MAG: zinc ribbon domain-containing protein [Treponema sp.]|nr:zinc ribbon domain-containing protein [Treponema sp.]